MEIKEKREEQYTLLQPGGEANVGMLLQLEKLVIENMQEGRIHFIIDLSNLRSSYDEMYYKLEKIYNIILKEDGILVIAAPPTDMEEALKAEGIITTPTQSEAVDYIFMESIERQLLDGSEGDDEPIE